MSTERPEVRRARKLRVASVVAIRQRIEEGTLPPIEPWPPVLRVLPSAEEHWRCPNCGAPCACSVEFRALPHIACGLAVAP